MKPDTTEARRLADELAADVASLLREGLPQEALRADAAQSAIRALADEHDSLRAEVAVLQMACGRWERALEHGADRVRNAENKCDSLRVTIAELSAEVQRLDQITCQCVRNNALMNNARQEAAELRAQVETLRADAERLHWVETQAIRIADECQNNDRWLVETLTSSATGETLRDAIDATRSQEAAG